MLGSVSQEQRLAGTAMKGLDLDFTRQPSPTMVQPAIGDPIAAVIAQLHHFQVTSLRLTKERWDAGIRRQLIVLPTGSGKTVVLAVLPQYIGFNRRILVLVQRDTLAHQAKRQIEHWNPDVGEVGIEMGPTPSLSRRDPGSLSNLLGMEG